MGCWCVGAPSPRRSMMISSSSPGPRVVLRVAIDAPDSGRSRETMHRRLGATPVAGRDRPSFRPSGIRYFIRHQWSDGPFIAWRRGISRLFSPCRLDTRRRSRLVSCSRRIATKSLRRAARSIVVMIGAVFALLIVGMALFAGGLAPYPPDEQNFDLIEAKPGAKALFGTDRFGRDVLSRVICGAGAGRQLAGGRAQAPVAERAVAVRGARHGGLLAGNPHRGLAELSRTVGAAADTVVGQHAERGAHVSGDRAVDLGVPGRGDHDRRAGVQPDRRRTPRHSRPERIR